MGMWLHFFVIGVIDILAVCKIYKEKHNNMSKSIESLEKTLLKPYSKWAMKIRRIIFNLYRPVLHDKSTSKFNQDLMAYIMLGLFTCSVVLFFSGVKEPTFAYPFIAGWIVIPITWIYFRFFPQTWVEMYEYEKIAFRQLHKLPPMWEPKA